MVKGLPLKSGCQRRHNVIMKQATFILKAFLLLVWIWPGIHVCGQGNFTVDVQHYGMDEGLSHREVHGIFQDEDGFLWVGTRFGLNRFDGYDFKWWTAEQGEYFNNISRIGQDDGGWLWLFNDKELFFMHPHTFEVKTLEEKFPNGVPIQTKLQKAGSWKFWDKRNINKDKKGRLVFIAEQPARLVWYDHNNGFSEKDISKNLIKPVLHSLTSDNAFLVSSKNSLYEINAQGVIERETLVSGSRGFYNGKELQGKIYFDPTETDKGKEIWYEWKENNQHEELVFKDDVLSKKEKPDELFWVKKDRYYLYDSDGHLIIKMQGESIPDKFNNFTNIIYKNSPFQYWIGNDFGLYKVTLKPKRFQSWFSFEGDEQKPFNNSTRGMVVDGNQLVANFEMGGLTGMDLKSLDSKNFNLINRTLEGAGSVQPDDGRYDYWTRPLLMDQQGYWLGGRFALRFYNKNTKQVEAFPYASDIEKKPIDIWALYKAPDQTLWLGTGNGLAYKTDSEAEVKILPPQDAAWEFESAVVLHFSPESESKVWLCSNNGLYLFDINEKKIINRYWSKGKDEQNFPANDIKYIHKDKNGIYWLASSSGLIKWNKEEGTYRLYNRKDGFTNDNFYVVYEDEKEHLWMSSDYGIVQFGKEHETIRTYLPEDGLPHHEFNRISHFKDKNGHIYFGSMNGVASFDPKDFYNSSNSDSEKFIILKCEVFDKKEDRLVDKTNEVRSTKTIEIKASDGFFNLEFALMNFEDPATNQYAYQIEGMDKGWTYQSQNKIRINHLPYGERKLYIRGFNTQGESKVHEIALNLKVKRPYYLQPWFVLALLGSLLLLTYLLYRWRIDQLNRQKEVLEEEVSKATAKILKDKSLIEDQAKQLQTLNETKDRIFSILGYDLRKPAMAFRGLSDKMNFLIKRKDMDTIAKMGDSLEDNATLLHNVVDNIYNWSLLQGGGLEINPTVFNLNDLIRDVCKTMQRFAETNALTIKQDFEPQLMICADQSISNTIVRNLLDNAIKYSTKGETISIVEETGSDTHVCVLFCNYGKTISPNQLESIFALNKNKQSGIEEERGVGLGLYLVHELVLLIGGEIAIESSEDGETCVELKLPRATEEQIKTSMMGIRFPLK